MNIADGNITTHHTSSDLGEIKQLFDQLYTKIETHKETPTTVKEDLNAEVKEIQSAVMEATERNKKVDGAFCRAASATLRAWRPISWM
jgi:DNA anti-recombination protein RmuC